MTVDSNTEWVKGSIPAEGEEERRNTVVDKFKLGIGERGIDIRGQRANRARRIARLRFGALLYW